MPASTVVITGASSGIGQATARGFASRGWNVVATMRRPPEDGALPASGNLRTVALDVQDPASIATATEAAIAAFGGVDVWVNNAGYGAFGPTEAASHEQIARQFEVNVFGALACAKAILPHFRARRSGVLVNVTSAGGLAASPGFALYNASKFALEGLSEGLWYELAGFGVRVKVVEPGVTQTDFGGRSMDVLDYAALPDYGPLMATLEAALGRFAAGAASPERVAAEIFRAATDGSDRLRYQVGADTRQLWGVRRWLGPELQMRIVRRIVGLARAPAPSGGSAPGSKSGAQ